VDQVLQKFQELKQILREKYPDAWEEEELEATEVAGEGARIAGLPIGAGMWLTEEVGASGMEAKSLEAVGEEAKTKDTIKLF